MSARVIICGAGWAGLNAARNLVAAGFEVKVLEKSERPGGRITTDEVDGFLLDRGFQVINPRYAELVETGILRALKISSLPKGIDLIIGGKLIPVGDFRNDLRYLHGDLSPATGRLMEKLRFLRYLLGPTADISFGAAIAGCDSFYTKTLQPFLDGVVLGDSSATSNRAMRELIHWFIAGSPGIVAGGIARASEALADGLDIEYGAEVISASEEEVISTAGTYSADAVLIALDPKSAAALIGSPAPQMNGCTTWYFKIPEDAITSKRLRAGGVGPLVNSLVLSNVERSYAPPGSALLQATSLRESTESEVRTHLKGIWGDGARELELITRYEISAALPFHAPGQELVAPVRDDSGLFLAGDWRNIPAQQGALLSGRLAARAITSALSGR